MTTRQLLALPEGSDILLRYQLPGVDLGMGARDPNNIGAG